MPLVRITYPSGALPQPVKAKLAAELTEVVLEAEVDAVTPAGRAVTIVQFTESAASDWAVGGVLRSDASGPPNHFLVDVIVLDGLLEGERRAAVQRRVTEAFQKALPDEQMLPMRVWVLVHEVPEGCWGVAGRGASALDVAGFINHKMDPARRMEIAEALARRR